MDGWPKIKANVKAVNRRIEALLAQIDPVAINGSRITLVSPYDFHRNRVNTDEVRQVIEEVIEHQFGEKVSITCVSRSEMTSMAASQPGPGPQPAQTPRPASQPAPVQPEPEAEPAAPMRTAEPPSLTDAERQIEAARNIFDADIEMPKD